MSDFGLAKSKQWLSLAYNGKVSFQKMCILPKLGDYGQTFDIISK